MRSELYFDHASTEQNKAMFDRLSAVRVKFEEAYGGPLLFDRLDGKKACRVEAESPPASIDQREEWPAYLDWMVDSQFRLRGALAAVGGAGVLALA
jgi:hypothetical protein